MTKEVTCAMGLSFKIRKIQGKLNKVPEIESDKQVTWICEK